MALKHDPSFLKFHKVFLRTMDFLPKVVSNFNANEVIVLLVFFPAFCKYYTLQMLTCLQILTLYRDVRRSTYLQRTTKLERMPFFLFDMWETWMERSHLLEVSHTGYFSLLRLCCEVAKNTVQKGNHGHLTRVEASSNAILKGAPVEVICTTAMWSSSSMPY